MFSKFRRVSFVLLGRVDSVVGGFLNQSLFVRVLFFVKERPKGKGPLNRGFLGIPLFKGKPKGKDPLEPQTPAADVFFLPKRE